MYVYMHIHMYLHTHIHKIDLLSYICYLYFHVFQSKYSMIFITFDTSLLYWLLYIIGRCVIHVEQFGHVRYAYLRLSSFLLR